VEQLPSIAMLCCYNHTICLPQSDLVYVAFRLALCDTLLEIELSRDSGAEMDEPIGYLTEVPFLEQVPTPVQVDLLADVWTKHQDRSRVQAYLLDAAVVYAVCATAARVVRDEPSVGRSWLRSGPRTVRIPATPRTAERIETLFEDFWDDVDFLTVSELQDLEPEKAREIKQLIGIDETATDPMFNTLARCRVSPAIESNLAGLLTGAEIGECMQLLQ
jgi:hypothetical protein